MRTWDQKPLRRDRQQLDGEAFHPDMFAQISGDDLAVLQFNRRDIGADRAEIVVNAFGEQRARIVSGAHDRGLSEIGGPALRAGAPDHHTVGGAVRGHHRGPRDLDFLLQRRGHSAASKRLEIISLSSKLRHGAECATTSPMMRMAGPPSIRLTSSGNSSSVPTAALASGRVTRANTPTGVRGERPAASMPSRMVGAAVMPI